MTIDESELSRSIRKTRANSDSRRHDTLRLEGAGGRSGGNRADELEAAIANITRLLARAEDPEVAGELVAERRARARQRSRGGR
jgi:hypothetical protein